MSVRDVRQNLAQIVNDAAVKGITTHLTNRGRRVGVRIQPDRPTPRCRPLSLSDAEEAS